MITIKKIINFIFFILFTFSLIAFFFLKDDLLRSNNVIAIKWCKGKDTKDYIASRNYYGVYIYITPLDDGTYALQGQIFSGIRHDIFQPYRLYLTDVIAIISDKKIAEREWSLITCNPNGEIEVGNEHYIIPQDFITIN
ncbi:hypothetical protein GJ200_16350 [Salmonella enterica subsp. enterica]|nr:hypothetical protein [Salmonella enterica subsp. enterica]EBY5131708.1 hypothetical protein [Salmonella enterica subsp. enterica serovar Brazzaville]HAV1239821.1 hypothetical protein [Salmonella enterica]ECE6340506.1 hypothetical protein [Salmonella enterica subsp. enterica]ECG1260168.1 hypothetical protein [Salmonella enterica subsp. enterica]